MKAVTVCEEAARKGASARRGTAWGVWAGAALLFAASVTWSQAIKEIPTGAEPHTLPIGEQLKLSPLPAAQKEQAVKAFAARDITTVEKILVQAVNADPKSSDLLLLAARVFFLDKNPGNAAIAFKKAEKLAPLTPPDRFTLAMAYLGLGKSEWARPELTRLATEAPQNPLYPYWIARLDYDKRDYAPAVQRLRGIVQAHPAFLKAWDVLGLALEGDGKLEDAVLAYREAVRLNHEQKPQSAWPALNLGTLLNKMERLKEAEQMLREATSIEPNLGEARYRLGLNLHKQNRDHEAIAEFQRAVELDPKAPEPHYLLSQIYRATGDSKAAEASLARFKQLKAAKRGE